MHILVTGASGFIGQALCASLQARHTVVGIGRGGTGPKGVAWARGDFASFEDLRQLDMHPIDAVIHLAAVTGGCLERDGMLVNVEGTRCLMRYLIDRGCKKYVLASSIAAVGAEDTAFRPVKLPMPDEHPCLDTRGYGFSKYMMEEVAKYHARQNSQVDVINLRLAAIVPDESPPTPTGLRDIYPFAACSVALMRRRDAVRVFTLAVESPHKSGVRTMNAAGSRVWASVPTADLLRNWWGDGVDLSHYRQADHLYDGLYDVRRIKAELGFVAEPVPTDKSSNQ